MSAACLVVAVVFDAEVNAVTEAVGPNFWSAAPTILWVLFAASLFAVFHNQLKDLLLNLSWRVRSGMPLKVGSVELGPSYVPFGGSIQQNEGLIQTREDKDGARSHERDLLYGANRRIFLVHKLGVSREPGQLYDVQLYLVPHKDATLACVAQVEYFLGRYWGNKIFVVYNRATGFLMSTTAYGPLVATAELHFTDGTKANLWRYIDFEMGPVGREPMEADQQRPRRYSK